MKKKIVSLIVSILMVLGSSICANAADLTVIDNNILSLSNEEIKDKYGAFFTKMENDYATAMTEPNIAKCYDLNNHEPVLGQISTTIKEEGKTILLTSLMITEPKLNAATLSEDPASRWKYTTLTYGEVYQEMNYKIRKQNTGVNLWYCLTSIQSKAISVNSGFRCTGQSVQYGQSSTGGESWNNTYSTILTDLNLSFGSSKYIPGGSNSYLQLFSTFKYRRGNMTSDYVQTANLTYNAPEGEF